MLSLEDATAALKRIHDTRSDKIASPGWNTLWQLVCRSTWNLLHNGSTVDHGYMNTFLSIMQEDASHFELARLVIPDFRSSDAATNLQTQQKMILQAISGQRTAWQRQWQPDMEDPLYVAERNIFFESDIHRARLLLLQRRELSQEQYDSIESWWNGRPKVRDGAGQSS